MSKLVSQLNRSQCEVAALAKQVELLRKRCNDKNKKCVEYNNIINMLLQKLGELTNELENKQMLCDQYKNMLKESSSKEIILGDLIDYKKVLSSYMDKISY